MLTGFLMGARAVFMPGKARGDSEDSSNKSNGILHRHSLEDKIEVINTCNSPVKVPAEKISAFRLPLIFSCA